MTAHKLLTTIRAVQEIITKHRTAVRDRIKKDTRIATQRITDAEQKTITSLRASLHI